MDHIIKQFTTGIGGVLNFATAAISPFKIQSVDFETYKKSCQVIYSNECIYLFKKTGISECVAVSLGPAKKSYSLFRQTNEIEAKCLYDAISKTLVQVWKWCPTILTEDVLQKFCDCAREHQTWSVMHVSAFIGLHSALEQKELQSFMDTQCAVTMVTPLMTGIMGKQFKSVEVLLEMGASINLVDRKGNSAYHLAVTIYPSVINILKDFDKSGMINSFNTNGETPLYLACVKKNHEATEKLILAGGDPSLTKSSLLPIHIAVTNEDIRSIEAITSKHLEQLNARDTLGCTPVHHACTEEMVSKLTNLGCDINLCNADGETPLLWMMREKKDSCILALLCYGANGNMQNCAGDTVLHKAVMKDDPEMVRTFIVFNVDPNIKNLNNHTARHLASISQGKHREFAELQKDDCIEVFVDSELILYLLHMSGAERCTTDVKGCLAGCVTEGNHSGVPDKILSSLMRTDSVALFDELLSAPGTGRNATMTNNSHSVLDMVPIPNNIGDRVLSLDGGGIRGLVLIQMLMEIETMLEKPIRECFEWIGGTSTGGILALAIAKGLPLAYIKGLYVRMKDEVFKGSRPYSSQLFEEMLKREFGETSVMADIIHPKVMVTATLADRYPAAFHIFRNYSQPFEEPHSEQDKTRRFPCQTSPEEQLVWEAARSTGAAPTYFRAYGHFMDGGLISNNPTLDMLTEIHEYNTGLDMVGEGHKVQPIGCVVSLGTGRSPITDVKNLDVFRPEGIKDAYRAVSGVLSLSRMLIDQASQSEGRVVDRARAWCSMIKVPYFRFSPQLTVDVPLDCHDHTTLINMMWETHCYMIANRHRVHELTNLLKASE